MAIKLSANYSKKLGLPQYSSHSFSASVEVELNDISQVEAEVQKLYQLLQQSVDQEIQQPGFVPTANTNGNSRPAPQQKGRAQPVNGSGRPSASSSADRWNCTDGQRGFILRIVNENPGITKQVAEDLSQQLFGIGVKQLNKMQASQLIEDLLVMAGKPAPRQTRWQQQPTNAQAA
ncbi:MULTISPECIES: hypothetical protein [Prosthecobacter]|uniref:Uncharacterized protein n=1 Tax=Prosthecobacter vanneervenii TaxID=48466 RepID=A0A7W8DLG5_9BACT|nr:hypothetical protein [Prosthecobacter vanneervenii]MBB5033801.1 hypothetical protein [Prosthecobacter vanneervenii]